jgi:class 3 adenylate cyclase/tetratricopeptide (TPR) repeat protein
LHTGRFHFFAVGKSHLELLPTGPAWSCIVAMEHVAEAGEIVMSPQTAGLLPLECGGLPKGDGLLLAQAPWPPPKKPPRSVRPPLPAEALANCLSPTLRAHVLAGGGAAEHRPVTMAFVRFEGIDGMLAQQGPEATAGALNHLVSTVEAAADAHQVTFLASDVDADGGKIILTAGAPNATVDDEERMLLALRRIVDAPMPLSVRVGVHRGAVFAGDIGPKYRRTYTVMGDAVNLTARLMAKAERGAIYATPDVLQRSRTQFDASELAPFAVKGKAEPVRAWSVGRAQSSKARQAAVSVPRLPITGRNVELGIVRKAFASARAGAGRLLEVTGEPGVGKTRLLEALRDAAAGFRNQHAACEAYTASTPYALWHELLRELMDFGRDDPDERIAERLRDEVTAKVPDLVPWLPLLGIAFGVEFPATPEVEMLAELNRRPRLHESLLALLQVLATDRLLVEIENAHHMDEASAELLAYLVPRIGTQPWLFAVARRPGAGDGFVAADADTLVRVELKPLAPADALRLAQLATEQAPLPVHVLDVVAKRSGGNPQFLRDLVRTAVESGGVADLPDSAEAAAIAQIDDLAPEDRAVVRRAAVFGNTFHPRMLAWLCEDDDDEFKPPTPQAWSRLHDFFEEESDGYLRFRRTLLRDAAYEGLPYKLRRRLHGAVAAHLVLELDSPSEAAGTLALHYFEAGDYAPAWRYGVEAARRAEGVYAHVEAAGLYNRALKAAHELGSVAAPELARVHADLGDAWYRAGEFAKAADAFNAARPLAGSDPLLEADLLSKLGHVEAKLGTYPKAREWTEQARKVLAATGSRDAAVQLGRAGAWYAMLLQIEGRNEEALEWAGRAVVEAQAAGDDKALGEAYAVIGGVQGTQGKGGEEFMQRALEAFKRTDDLVHQVNVLSDLGVLCHWTGRWDEALSYWEQARAAALKTGSTVNANLVRLNMSEILIDRGEWAQGEAVLLETLSFWKASQFHFFLGACLFLLGRASLRSGRLDEATSRLEEAKAKFRQVGAETEIPQIDARIAECRLARGDTDGALVPLAALLDQRDNAAVQRLLPLLERLHGHVLMRQDDLWGARDALEASLAAARERHEIFEGVLTTLSLIALDRLEGVEPAHEMLTESREVLDKLKIRAVPPVPLPAR